MTGQLNLSYIPVHLVAAAHEPDMFVPSWRALTRPFEATATDQGFVKPNDPHKLWLEWVEQRKIRLFSRQARPAFSPASPPDQASSTAPKSQQPGSRP